MQPEWAVTIETHSAAEAKRVHEALTHLGPRYATRGKRVVEVRVRAPSESDAVRYVSSQAERLQIAPSAVTARRMS